MNIERKKMGIFSRVVSGSTYMVERLLPNAYVFAAVLTPIVLLGSMIFTKQSPITMIQYRYKGFWSLHTFAMQMSLIIITGYALALSPFFKKILSALASIPKTNTQGIVIVTFIAAIASWINWGFGLVIGAIYAKEVAKRLPNIDYRLLVASAYSGFLVWHAGFTGSIPLKIATAGSDLEKNFRRCIYNSNSYKRNYFCAVYTGARSGSYTHIAPVKRAHAP